MSDTTRRTKRALEIASEAVAVDRAGRDAFLTEACGDDALLRREVEELLSYETDPRDPLQPADPRPLRPAAPERVGPYRILGRLGGGGSGVVFEAEQSHPQRSVALKLLRTDFEDPEALQRFAREVELLGRLQHEGVARIYDAGCDRTATGEERPWYAMELVIGERPIEHANRHGLDLRARMLLLAKVADAVAHAHQLGVVHRDLKPANILVDKTGQPKVLDFGIARVLDQHAPTDSLRTQTGAIVGTVAYMSPEQAAGHPDEVGARTDVHALGVLGYELIAGHLPYEIEGEPLPRALQILQTAMPIPLSRAAPRTPKDLVTILGKAIEKSPSDRYEHAGALADDIRRFLRDEPIVARPPSTTYLAYKFARRNRRLVAGTGAFVLLLIAGIITTWIQARTSDQLAREAQSARDAEKEKRAASEQVLAFWTDVVMQAAPEKGGSREITVTEALKRAEQRIDYRFGDKPLAEAGLRHTLGKVYRHLVQFEAAERHLRRCLELRLQEKPIRHYFVGEAYYQLGNLLMRQDRFEEARDLLEQCVAHRKRDNNPETTAPSLVAEALMSLAMVHEKTNDVAAAEPLYAEALAIHAKEGTESLSVAAAQNNFGQFLSNRDQAARAIPYLENAVAMYRRLGQDPSVYLAVGWNNLALARRRNGEFDGALQTHEDSVAMARQVYGDTHPNTGLLRLSCADAYLEVGKTSEALAHATAAEAIQRQNLPQLKARGEALLADALQRVATAHLLEGKLDAAATAIDEAIGILGKKTSADPKLRKKLEVRARIDLRAGRGDRGRQTSAECLEAARQRNRGVRLLPYLCTFCEAHDPSDPAGRQARAELERIFAAERARVPPALRARCLALTKPSK